MMMKKNKSYKLKKWYPSLPKDWKEGLLVTKKTIDSIDYNPNCVGYYHYKILCIEVENNPEFWEEVIEKDYEILSFKPTDKHTGGVNELITLQDVNFYRYQFNWAPGACTLDEMLISVTKGNNIIYSVKRLSDGEIFTIGDNTSYGILSLITIGDEAQTSGCSLYFGKETLKPTMFSSKKELQWDNCADLCFKFYNDLSNPFVVQKVKQPLFKTEDGVDIYEGITCYGVTLCYNVIKYDGNKYGVLGNVFFENKWFSTKEKAEEYVIMNKPCLSINDLKIQFNLFGDRGNNELALKVLVKSKL